MNQPGAKQTNAEEAVPRSLVALNRMQTSAASGSSVVVTWCVAGSRLSWAAGTWISGCHVDSGPAPRSRTTSVGLPFGST